MYKKSIAISHFPGVLTVKLSFNSMSMITSWSVHIYRGISRGRYTHNTINTLCVNFNKWDVVYSNKMIIKSGNSNKLHNTFSFCCGSFLSSCHIGCIYVHLENYFSSWCLTSFIVSPKAWVSDCQGPGLYNCKWKKMQLMDKCRQYDDGYLVNIYHSSWVWALQDNMVG